jgi:hypothetical protein
MLVADSDIEGSLEELHFLSRHLVRTALRKKCRKGAVGDFAWKGWKNRRYHCSPESHEDWAAIRQIAAATLTSWAGDGVNSASLEEHVYTTSPQRNLLGILEPRVPHDAAGKSEMCNAYGPH